MFVDQTLITMHLKTFFYSYLSLRLMGVPLPPRLPPQSEQNSLKIETSPLLEPHTPSLVGITSLTAQPGRQGYQAAAHQHPRWWPLHAGKFSVCNTGI